MVCESKWQTVHIFALEWMALDRVLKLWQAAKRSWGVKLVEVVEKLLRIVVGRFVSRHDATRQTSDKLCCRVAIGIATNQVEYFPLFCVHQVEGTSVVPVCICLIVR